MFGTTMLAWSFHLHGNSRSRPVDHSSFFELITRTVLLLFSNKLSLKCLLR